MSLLLLALNSLRNRRFTAIVTAATMALSIGLLLSVERIRAQARDGFASTLSGTDLVVGARTGPVNLLLYAVFHIGDPTNNVSWESFAEISAGPDIAWSVPLSLGDSHRGFRVIGTTSDLFDHYRYGAARSLDLSSGVRFRELYDAVIGADVAEALHYTVGTRLVLAHGTGRVTFVDHADTPFRVSGILARTGTPLDGAVLVSLRAIEAIHADWRSGVHLPGSGGAAREEEAVDSMPHTITAFLIGLKSRLAIFSVQSAINDHEGEPLLAIIPGVALQQLWKMSSMAEGALLLVAALVVVVGFAGLVTALVTSLSERRREMAILRAVGARPRQVFGLLMLESMLLTVAAAALGMVLAHLATDTAQPILLARFGIRLESSWPSSSEWIILLGVLLTGLIAGLVPAAMAYRHALSDGLTLRK